MSQAVRHGSVQGPLGTALELDLEQSGLVALRGLRRVGSRRLPPSSPVQRLFSQPLRKIMAMILFTALAMFKVACDKAGLDAKVPEFLVKTVGLQNP